MHLPKGEGVMWLKCSQYVVGDGVLTVRRWRRLHIDRTQNQVVVAGETSSDTFLIAHEELPAPGFSTRASNDKWGHPKSKNKKRCGKGKRKKGKREKKIRGEVRVET